MAVAFTTDGSTAFVDAPFDDRPVEGAGATYIFNVGVDDHEVGFELYYNARITPWFDLSFDLQAVDSAFRPNGTPVVWDIRAYLEF